MADSASPSALGAPLPEPAGGLAIRAVAWSRRTATSGRWSRTVKTFSGGMRRRIDVSAALVARPPIVFLDEPTIGLDPRSRLNLWETIESLVADGTTVLLTTQYLDAGDRLADAITVIDHGKVIARARRTSSRTGSAASGSRSRSSRDSAARRDDVGECAAREHRGPGPRQ